MVFQGALVVLFGMCLSTSFVGKSTANPGDVSELLSSMELPERERQALNDAVKSLEEGIRNDTVDPLELLKNVDWKKFSEIVGSMVQEGQDVSPFVKMLASHIDMFLQSGMLNLETVKQWVNKLDSEEEGVSMLKSVVAHLETVKDRSPDNMLLEALDELLRQMESKRLDVAVLKGLLAHLKSLENRSLKNLLRESVIYVNSNCDARLKFRDLLLQYSPLLEIFQFPTEIREKFDEFLTQLGSCQLSTSQDIPAY